MNGLEKYISTDIQTELNRLMDLKELNILDTEIQDNYEHITKLFQKIFDVPIVLISLVDRNRQWFKSHIGLDACETKRGYSFCSNAIKSNNKLYIIEDASKDDFYKNNPLVTGYPHIRFYAGCVIKSPKLFKIGTICIIDTKPRKLTNIQKKYLKIAGEIVEGEIFKNFYKQRYKNQSNIVKKILLIKNRICPIKTFCDLLKIKDIDITDEIIDCISDNTTDSLEFINNIEEYLSLKEIKVSCLYTEDESEDDN